MPAALIDSLRDGVYSVPESGNAIDRERRIPMDERIDIEGLLHELLAGYDLDDPASRRDAYQCCLDYADLNLKRSLDRNAFISRASNVLGQEMVFSEVVRELVPGSGDEKVHMDYTPELGMVISGNRAGLVYLSRMIETLSRATLEGEHVHLHGAEWPLAGNSYPITWYLESERWFEMVDAESELTPAEGEAAGADRADDLLSLDDVGPRDTFGIQLLNPIPREMMMTPRRIYLVTRTEPYTGQKIWRKGDSESETMWVFHFIRDDGRPEKIALEPDDPDVILLRRTDLDQLLAGHESH